MNRIVSAAIITTDGVIHSLPPPARHHHILQSASVTTILSENQGFLTSEGLFVGRTVAMQIAREAGQLIRDETALKKYQGPLLFSEDLW
jgi:hypothetical protein